MARASVTKEKLDQEVDKLVEAVAAAKPAKPTRRRRNAFNGTEGKLTITGEIPGYHIHIMNDTPGRIATALDNGYEFVSPSEVSTKEGNVTNTNTDLGDKIRFRVGVDDSGNGLYAYVMKIRQEWYDEDRQALQGRVDAVDQAIKSGKMTANGHNAEGFYTPEGGIKYSK
jgi:hypothetical protein